MERSNGLRRNAEPFCRPYSSRKKWHRLSPSTLGCQKVPTTGRPTAGTSLCNVLSVSIGTSVDPVIVTCVTGGMSYLRITYREGRVSAVAVPLAPPPRGSYV